MINKTKKKGVVRHGSMEPGRRGEITVIRNQKSTLSVRTVFASGVVNPDCLWVEILLWGRATVVKTGDVDFVA